MADSTAGARAPGAGALSSIRLLFATAARSDRAGLLIGMTMLLVSTVLQPLFPLLFGRLVDAVVRESPDVSAAAAAGAAIALTSAGAAAGRNWSSMFLWNVWERMTITIDQQLVDLTGRVAYVEDAEQEEYLEHLTLVRRNRETFQESMMATLGSVGLFVQIGITVLILLTVAPLLLFLPLFAVAPVLASRWSEKRTQEAMARGARAGRAADGHVLLAMNAAMAGELRTLGLQSYLIERHRAAWRRVVAEQWRAETVGTAASAAALALFTLAFAGAVLFVTAQSLEGDASLGSVIVVITAGEQLHGQIGRAVQSSGAVFRIIETMRHYSWIARYAESSAGSGAGTPPSGLREGIRLEDVGFRYPGAEHDAVAGVSALLPAGSVVAVVGENGAGKSTLVALLCGMHRPTSGRILVDGADLADLDLDGWRARLAAAFQDFVRYEVLARESVGVGAVARIERADEVRGSLARADVADLEDELPEGLETPLGRAFLQGIDLSGGQWQKVALARSMMRDAPLVLALDEPTYSLDVESERRVYEWFARVARDANPIGTITVIVSHRFSTVRSADLVAVIHEGRLVEWGSHDELLAGGGRYAEMYRMQAEGYR
jgi:ATP-binding cassette subfamily B protein